MNQELSCYGYKSYLEILLSFGKEAKLGFLKNSGFLKDNPNSPTTNETPATSTKVFEASGYLARKLILAKSKPFHFITDLHAGNYLFNLKNKMTIKNLIMNRNSEMLKISTSWCQYSGIPLFK